MTYSFMNGNLERCHKDIHSQQAWLLSPQFIVIDPCANHKLVGTRLRPIRQPPIFLNALPISYATRSICVTKNRQASSLSEGDAMSDANRMLRGESNP